MNYLSLFSGIDAASVAWEPLGFKCLGFSEIEKFACGVLKHHYPNIKNYGDIKQITKEDLNEIIGKTDIIIGGSPCQSFSMAGKREGLKDDRGNLMWQYCRIVEMVRPRWFIWENVPNALAVEKGQAFSSLINKMANIGYSVGWRVLDSKWFGIPQQRRRVFLVGCIGNKQGPLKVLFETESGKPPPESIKSPRNHHTPKAWSSTKQVGGLKWELDTPYSGCIVLRDYKGICPGFMGKNTQKLVIEKEGDSTNVRRFTPLEYERLQGLPDNYTQIRWGNKEAQDCPVSPRYRAVGNSFAVPVVRWLGERIVKFENNK